MDRYQFEDHISDYIENNLGLSKRKEFERYLDNNPGSREKVDSIRAQIEFMKSLPVIKTSPIFIENLQERIAQQSEQNPQRKRPGNSIFGFTPLYAGLMTAFVIAFVYVGMELLPEGVSHSKSVAPQFTNEIPLQTVAPDLANQTFMDSTIESVEDSLNYEDNTVPPDININDRIQYVKNKR